jgi:hypothetical protein
MLTDYLVYVGIFDGLVFGVIGLKFLTSSLQKNAVKTDIPLAKIDLKKLSALSKPAKPVTVSEEIAEVVKKEPKADGLSSLISETRKNSKTCSTCAAYTTFFDIGRFKQEGMTSVGVISHLDTKHSAQGNVDA